MVVAGEKIGMRYEVSAANYIKSLNPYLNMIKINNNESKNQHDYF